MRPTPIALAAVTLSFLVSALVISADTDKKTGSEVEAAPTDSISDFTLRDFRGKEHGLKEAAGEKATVVVFLGTDCPLARLYGPRLASLAEEFADRGVAFLAIDSNRQDTLEKLEHYARVHGLVFPLLKDPGNTVADLFGAERTPEAFLLDNERKVRYRGRIDDQYGVGFSRKQVENRFLADAITSLLAEKAIERSFVEPVGCYIGKVSKKTPAGELTYSKHVAPILNAHCVECHREGEIGPFPLTNYEEVVGWADTIREVIEDGRMPPWHADPAHGSFRNDKRLDKASRETLFAWIDDGAAEGDRDDLPAAPEFAEGWRIPHPDVVFPTLRPIDVPAEGTVPYKYAVVDPFFEEDKWIRAAEARPENRAVVHHIVLFFVPPDARRGLNQELAFANSIATYAPGMPPTVYPEGAAKFVPAGSKLVFQLHYTPNGSPQRDRSYAGLIFAEKDDVQHRVRSHLAGNFRFAIPPGAPAHEVRATYRFDEDRRLLSLFPHMHLRGKSFRYEAVFPDGRREVLLDVPRYDFNWQNTYVFDEPRAMPRGTTLRCIAEFDNSEKNLANPDPTQTVRWGEQTWEEMMIGAFDTIPAK